MKKPSKNISTSLRGQREAGRSAIKPTVSGLKPASAVSMTVPGEGMVSAPPHQDMQDRSAVAYANATGSKVR